MVAAMINGVANASRHNEEVQFPTNGRSVQSIQRNSGSSGSRSRSNDVSVVIFDHLGNPV